MTDNLEDKALTEFRAFRDKAQAIYQQHQSEFERTHNGQYVCIAGIETDTPQFYFGKTDKMHPTSPDENTFKENYIQKALTHLQKHMRSALSKSITANHIQRSKSTNTHELCTKR